MKNLTLAAVWLFIIFLGQAIAQVQRCIGRTWTAQCNLPPSWGERGRGCNPRTMWWYDPRLNYCRQMWYRGCGGNNNRWCNRQECEQRCRRR